MKRKKEIDLVLLKRLAEVGLDNKQLSYVLGITFSDFNKRLSSGEISKPLSEGRVIFKYAIENSINKKAVGYTVSQERYFKVGSKLVRKTVKKHIPGNFRAAEYIYHRLEEKSYSNWKTTME